MREKEICTKGKLGKKGYRKKPAPKKGHEKKEAKFMRIVE
jgi:hypothetical protein